MFGLVILVGVLCTASIFFNVLTLALASRIALDQRDLGNALIEGHNHVTRRVGELGEKVENAMNCLLTLDATAADCSEPE